MFQRRSQRRTARRDRPRAAASWARRRALDGGGPAAGHGLRRQGRKLLVDPAPRHAPAALSRARRAASASVHLKFHRARSPRGTATREPRPMPERVPGPASAPPARLPQLEDERCRAGTSPALRPAPARSVSGAPRRRQGRASRRCSRARRSASANMSMLISTWVGRPRSVTNTGSRPRESLRGADILIEFAAGDHASFRTYVPRLSCVVM